MRRLGEVSELLLFTASCYSMTTLLAYMMLVHGVPSQQALIIVMYAPMFAVLVTDLMMRRRIHLQSYMRPLLIGPLHRALMVPIIMPWTAWMVGLMLAHSLGVGVRGPLVRLMHGPSEALSLAWFMFYALVNSLLTTVFTIGEEVAWRGYVYVKLEQILASCRSRAMKTMFHAMIVGAIWSLWHAPLIHYYKLNYPTTGLMGLLVQTPLMIVMSTLLKAIREDMGFMSCALLHATYNALSPYMYLSTPMPDIYSLNVGGPAIASWTIVTMAYYIGRDVRARAWHMRL